MTDGSSQGLFVIIAVVIFGIFCVIAYMLFGDKLKNGMNTIFGDSLEQATENLNEVKNVSSYKTESNQLYVKMKDDLYLIFFKDSDTYVRLIASSSDGTNFSSSGSTLNSDTTLVLPDKVDGLNVEELNSGIFASAKFNGELLLPKYLRKIGDSAFVNSEFTGKFQAPETLTYIGAYAFNSSNFTSISELSNIQYILDSAFYSSKFEGKLILSGKLATPIFKNTFANSKFTTVDAKSQNTYIMDGAIKMSDGSYFK